MKNILTIIILLTLSLASLAQEPHKLRIGADFGYVKPSGGSGLLFAIEPKYNVAQNVMAGFRWEVAYMTKEMVDGNGASSIGSSSANSSYLATLDRYFNKEGSKMAPYIGLGMGAYALANVTGTGTGAGGIASGNKFGGMLRAGFEKNRFRAGVAYNIIPASKYSPGIGDQPKSVKNSYFAFHIGLYIGGGQWGAPRPESKSEEKKK